MVRQSLRRTKRIRTAGFVASYSGLQIGWLIYTRSASRSDELPSIQLLLGGWTLTVIVAALLGQPRASGAASLAERHLDDYRPAFARFDRQLLIGVMAVVGVLCALVPGERTGTRIDATVAAQRLLPALVAMGLVWLAQRAIVARRQSLESLDLLRADDALRAVGVSALAGVGYGVPLMAIASVFWPLVIVHEPPGFATFLVSVFGIVITVTGWSLILGLGRISNEVVIYRHRLRSMPNPRPPMRDNEPVAA